VLNCILVVSNVAELSQALNEGDFTLYELSFWVTRVLLSSMLVILNVAELF